MNNDIWILNLDLSPYRWKDSRNKKSMKTFLRELRIHLSYHFRKDGFIVENVELSKVEYNESNGCGWLFINYDQVYFNSCLNINDMNQESIQLKFVWNSEIISIYPPVIFERDCDEI
jgi:hypothetical protein